MGRRLALLVATYQYEDTGLRQLTAPAHDAEALAAVLADPAIAGFEVATLINEPHHVVGRAIGDFYRDRRRDDLTLLYFTGHGLKDDAGNLYLAMSNTVRDNLLFTGLPADQVDHAMESCTSRQKVLVLDCCYSGAFPAGHLAKADTAVHTLERFQGRGRTVLTASDATQYSFEGDNPHGRSVQSVFTRHLVAGLLDGSADLDGDGDITLDELYSYVHDRVVEEMPQQRPKKQDNVEGRTVIARNVNWTLPVYLRHAIGSPIAADRLAALDGLAHLRRIGNEVVRERVHEEIRRLADDDSKQVSAAAEAMLGEATGPVVVPEVQPAPPSAEPDEPVEPPAPAEAPSVEPDPVAAASVEEPSLEPVQATAVEAPAKPATTPATKRPEPITLVPRTRRFPLPTTPRARILLAVALVLPIVAGMVTAVVLANKDQGSEGSQSQPAAFAVLRGFPEAVATGQFSASALQFTSDSKTLATISKGQTTLWDTSTGQLKATVNDIDGLVLSPDGTKLAALQPGGAAVLWDLATGKTTAALGTPQGSAVAAFSPNSKILAIASTCACTEDFDNPVKLWDTTTGQELRALSGHTNGVQSMSFSPDGTTLAAGAAGGGPVRLWNVATGQPTLTLTTGYMVKFSPDGNYLATSGEFSPERKAQVWDPKTGKVVATLTDGDPVEFSPDGKMLLIGKPRTGDPNAPVSLWQLPGGKSVPVSSAKLPTVFTNDWMLAIGGQSTSVRLYEFTADKDRLTLAGHTDLIIDMARSPDGKVLATASGDKTVRLWHL